MALVASVVLPLAQHHNSFSMHHVMNHSSSLNDLSSNRARVRHEGSLNQKRAMEGTMRDILSHLPPPPPKPRRGPGTSNKTPSKNFAQENIKRIRQVAAERREREDRLKKTAVRASWSVQRENGGPAIKRAETRAAEGRNRSRQPPGRARSFQDGLNHISVSDDEEAFEKPADPMVRRQSLVQAINLPSMSSKPSKDFVSLNKTVNFSTELRERRSSSTSSLGRRSSLLDLDEVPKAKIGVLPDYILKEKPPVPQKGVKYNGNELPLGYRVMGKSERTRITEGLQHAKATRERELFLLPLRSDTMRAQRKRDELQAALRDIDDGLHMLTRATVIVNGDNVPGSKYIKDVETSTQKVSSEIEKVEKNGVMKAKAVAPARKDVNPAIKKTMRRA
ncbi:hypothetical protein RvY_01970 [Ramazzottius varieornatus]|uniref:Enkurin domain-containing protein n=1 Tax=Ramazzottius varieornatus TaxID=947166 RepID=A0A1D1UI77_RAMVA|nr:hypothetical protein RvY_01970 [Ramazzottius varieornatus]